jgi:ABC transporter substrate binding protein
VVILTAGNVPTTLAAKAATQTIPIVFVIGADPVDFGLVASLARPGGNITGVTLIAPGLISSNRRRQRSIFSRISSARAVQRIPRLPLLDLERWRNCRTARDYLLGVPCARTHVSSSSCCSGCSLKITGLALMQPINHMEIGCLAI